MNKKNKLEKENEFHLSLMIHKLENEKKLRVSSPDYDSKYESLLDHLILLTLPTPSQHIH